jgi:quercetin dioxygenase-like cupin family protein
MGVAQTRTSSRPRAGHGLIEGTLSKPLLEFDLLQEIEQRRHEQSWQQGAGRSSKTLVKHGDLRIVLIVLKANTRMREHKATARVSIQTLSGRIRLHLPDRVVELPTGHLLALDQCLPHDVEALEDSAFLLTLSWPSEGEIEECKARQKRRVRHDGIQRKVPLRR